MPYIEGSARKRLDAGGAPETAGELNYAITRAVNEYLSHEDVRYSRINDVVGVLDCIRLDLYNQTSISVVRSHDEGLEALRTIITKFIDGYLRRSGGGVMAAVGVLQCAMLEFYRRVATPYEDKKIRENGDVYSVEL